MSVRTPAAAAVAGVTLLALAGTPAQAQPVDGSALRPGQIVVGASGTWLGGDDLGAVRAETRSSAPGTTMPPAFALFDTASRLDGGIGGAVSVLVAVTPRWALEARGGFRRPTLTTTISGDVERSGTFTAAETVAEYELGGSLVYHPGWPRLGARLRPYLLAGGGYLRQLHDEDALVATGSSAHAGGGLRWWLAGAPGQGRAMGVTADARWILRRRAITFADGARSLPAASLGLFVAL
jgi:hypothetical protein